MNSDLKTQASIMRIILTDKEIKDIFGRYDSIAGNENPLIDQTIQREKEELFRKLQFYLESRIKSPMNSTNRVRAIQRFINGSNIKSRSQYLLNLSSGIRFNAYIPTIPLSYFREWRNICSEIGEEALVAVRLSNELLRKYPDPSSKKTFLFLCDVIYMVSKWPVFLYPNDLDFLAVIEGGLTDAHIHYGERYPAPLLWNAIATGEFELSSESKSELFSEFETADIKNIRKEFVTKSISQFVDFDYKEFEDFDLFFQGIQSYIGNDKLRKSFSLNIAKNIPLIRKYLFCERLSLVLGFYLQLDKKNVFTEFWEYLYLRENFLYALTPHESGFRSFEKIFKPWNSSDLDPIFLELSNSWLVDTGIQKVDIRINIKDKPTKKMRYVFSTLNKQTELNSDLIWNLVFSFTKRNHSEIANCYGIRYDNWRNDRNRVQNLVEAILLSEFNSESTNIDPKDERKENRIKLAGFDAISSEYGYDVGILAPIFQNFRNSRTPFQFNPLKLKNIDFLENEHLKRFYHHGEDIDHPITSSRITWEAINWLCLEGGDRLGHLSFLAYSQEAETRSVDETQGERLDNLLWIYNYCKSDDIKESLRREIEQLSSSIYKIPKIIPKKFLHIFSNPNINDLEEAWKLRPLEENIIDWTFNKSSELCYLAYSGLTDFNQIIDLKNAVDDEFFHALSIVIEEWRKNRSIMIRGAYSKTLVEISLQSAKESIKQKGVLIETCPSSNLFIGSNFQMHTPGSSFFQSDLRPNLVLGSDDPSLFRTDLRVECAILFSELLSRGIPRREVYKEFVDLLSLSKNNI